MAFSLVRRLAIVAAAGAVIAACAPPPPQQNQPEPTVAQVTIMAAQDANPDPNGRPPVDVAACAAFTCICSVRFLPSALRNDCIIAISRCCRSSRDS